MTSRVFVRSRRIDKEAEPDNGHRTANKISSFTAFYSGLIVEQFEGFKIMYGFMTANFRITSAFHYGMNLDRRIDNIGTELLMELHPINRPLRWLETF